LFVLSDHQHGIFGRKSVSPSKNRLEVTVKIRHGVSRARHLRDQSHSAVRPGWQSDPYEAKKMSWKRSLDAAELGDHCHVSLCNAVMVSN